MAVFYDVGLFSICMILQTVLLYFCLELLFDRFLYRLMIKLLLYAFFLLLRLCTVFWVTSPIVAWLLSFSAILLLAFYYRSNRIRKYLIAAVFSSLLVFSESFMFKSFSPHTISLIGGIIMLQCTLLILYLFREKQLPSPFSPNHLDLCQTDTLNIDRFASDVSETAETISRLRHDLKHHIVTLKTLAEHEDCAAIIQYLHTMESDVSVADTYISTNNAGIDSLLNTMIAKAASCHCFINMDVLLPEHVNFPLSSINTILGNSIENAIEAAALSEEKKVGVSIYIQKGVMYIDVSNTYGNAPAWQSGRLLSNKKPGKGYGIGLRSMETAVKKLNGILEYQYDEKIFRILIMIYID
jgi:hypothetical protein